MKTKRTIDRTKYRYVWKALSPYGSSDGNGVEFFYRLPVPGERWSDWTIAPNQPENVDGKACGAGGLHLHKRPTYQYAPRQAWLWLARYLPGDVLGEDAQKIRVRKLQLLRISHHKFEAMIKRGLLRGANLRDANLQGANLQGANLQGANLQGADLQGANLQGANLQGANLQGADLQGANLQGADLQGANLQGADLQGANLQGANLWRADLWRADLREAKNITSYITPETGAILD